MKDEKGKVIPNFGDLVTTPPKFTACDLCGLPLEVMTGQEYTKCVKPGVMTEDGKEMVDYAYDYSKVKLEPRNHPVCDRIRVHHEWTQNVAKMLGERIDDFEEQRSRSLFRFVRHRLGRILHRVGAILQREQ